VRRSQAALLLRDRGSPARAPGRVLAHESERRLGLGNRGGGGWRIWISVGVGRLGKTRKEGGAGGWLDFWIGEDPEEEGTRRVAALGRGWMGQDP